MKPIYVAALAAVLAAIPAMTPAKEASGPAPCVAGLKMVAMIKRKPGMTPQQFRHHYENKHEPLAMKLIGRFMTDYRRNYIADGAYDVISEYSVATRADMEAMMAVSKQPEVSAQLGADAAEFMDLTGSTQFTVDECRTKF